VKFAKLSPLPDENSKMLSNAYHFVKETTGEQIAEFPKEPAKPEESEAAVVDLKDKKEDNQL